MGDRIIRSVIGSGSRQAAPVFDRRTVRPPWTRDRVQRFSFAGGALAVVVISLWVAKINPLQAITSLRQIWDTVRLYFPPDFTTDRGNLISGTLQSASVAMVATSIGFLLQSVQILAYRTTGAVIILIFSVVLVIEIITNWVRKHLI